MNFLGQPINNNSLNNGGVITGNLNIEADLTVTGDADFQDITATNAVITGTLEANTIIADLVIEDPLIHLAKDNPADALNLGVLEEFNDGDVKFSGIVRSKDNKKQYLLEGVTPQPTGTTDITSLNRGDLVINDLAGNLLVVNNVAATQAVNAQSFGIANIALVGRYQIDHETATDDLRFLNALTTPVMSLSQSGELTVNELNIINNGFKSTDGLNYEHEYVQGFDYHKTFKNGNPGPTRIDQKASGSIGAYTTINNGDIISNHIGQGYDGVSFANGFRITILASETWSPTNRGTLWRLQTTNVGASTMSTKMTIGDAVIINDGLNSYTLPSTRGSASQVLKDTLGDGVLTWETETASSETLQEAYNASTAPHITTTDAKGPLTLKHAGEVGIANVFTILDSTDTVKFQVDKNGGFSSTGYCQTSSFLQGQDVRCIDSLEVGSGAGVSYKFPPNRTGITDGEMLTLDDATSTLQFIKPLYFYNFTQNVTTSNITGTTNEINITSPTGIGSLVLSANSLMAGSTYHIKCGGTIENASVGDDIRLRFKLGTSVIIDTGVIDLPKIGVGQPWIFEGDITFRTIGLTAGSVFNGQFSFNDAGSYLGKNITGAGATIDTTITNTWSGTSAWTNASVTNKLYTQILYFYRVS